MSTGELAEEDQLLLVNRLLPHEVGLFKHRVVHTCLDVTEFHLAVGSEQGNFWVVNLKARRMLMKEVTVSRVPVCTIGLNPKHAYVATGNKEGVVEVTNYLKPLIHEAVYEKACRPVSAMHWNQLGDKLFVGFDSGKLLGFDVNVNKLRLNVVPLLECEAEVIQLSSCKGLLLISTLAQSLLLSVDTGITNQVGSKERKPGRYGGCFFSDKDLMVARPGLRLWKANQLGKVQSTAKFREALESQPLPTIALYGNIVRPVQVQKGWQFSLLYSLADRYLVTFHANTLLVLEPETLLCVGVMSLGTEIVGVSTAGRHIFALCSGHQRPVVKLSLSAPQERQLTTSLLDTGYTLSQNTGLSADDTDQECSMPVACEQVVEDIDCGDANFSESAQSTPPLNSSSQEREDAVLTGFKSQPGSLPICQSSDMPSSEGVSPSSQISEKSILLLNAVEAKLQHMADKYLGKKGEQQDMETTATIPAVIVSALSSEEMDRRTKMVGVVEKEDEDDDDDVAVSAAVKKSRKSRKTKSRKRKKTSPVSSGATTPLQMFVSPEGAGGSVERLPQAMAAEGSDESQTALVSEHSTTLLSPHQEDLKEEQKTQPRVPFAEENKQEKKQNADPTSTLVCENEHGRQQCSTQPGMLLAGEKYEKHPDAHLQTLLATADEGDSQKQRVMKPMEGSHLLVCATNETGEHTVEPALLMSLQSEDGHEKQFSQDELSSSTISQHSFPSFVASSSPEHHHPLAVSTDSALHLKTGVEQQSLPSLLTDPSSNTEMEKPSTVVPKSDTRYSSQQSPLRNRLRSNAFRSPSPSDIDDKQTLGEEQASKQQEKQQGEDVKENLSLIERGNPSLMMPKEGLDSKGEISTSLQSLEQSLSESDEEPDHPSQSDVTSEHPLTEGSVLGQSKPEGQPLSLHHQQAANMYANSRVGKSLPSTPAPLPSPPPAGEVADSHSQEIWIPLPQPSAHHIQSICLSISTLWLTDSRGQVYCTRAGSGAQNWCPINKHMSQVSSSPSGKVVWGLHHNQIYVRQGISDLNPSGSVWRSLTKTSSHIKCIACDEAAVWAVETDGKVMYRRDVSEGQPQGTIWQQLTSQGISFVSVACCNNIVWALESSGTVYVRDKITPFNPIGKAWRCIWSPSFAAVSVVESGMVWGLDLTNRLWFRCGVTRTRPDGDGPWWEVSVSIEEKATTISPWKVMAVERSSNFLTSLISSHPKQGIVSACSRAGLCMLTSDGQLHACWKTTTGYHYAAACSSDLFELSTWKKVGAGSNRPWVIREDGELYCITSNEQAVHVECEGPAEVLATSPTAIWVFSKGQIWARQAMSKEIIQGISWEYIECGSHMCDAQIKALAIGNRAVWAIDNLGLVHFRFGVQPRNPGTGMSPAWVPVEGHAQPLHHICVSPDDWLVWAIDNNHNAYVRIGVTPDFPVGRRWEVVPGHQLKDVSAACGKVFALCVSGELLSRQGVSEDNPAGNYWHRLPGSFEQLSTSSSGELWVIEGKGLVKYQLTKKIDLCLGRSRQEELETRFSDYGWEVL